jgi:hypothetical protein
VEEEVNVIFMGLHAKLIAKMGNIAFFEEMLRKDEKCMFRIDWPETQN